MASGSLTYEEVANLGRSVLEHYRKRLPGVINCCQAFPADIDLKRVWNLVDVFDPINGEPKSISKVCEIAPFNGGTNGRVYVRLDSSYMKKSTCLWVLDFNGEVKQSLDDPRRSDPVVQNLCLWRTNPISKTIFIHSIIKGTHVCLDAAGIICLGVERG